MDNLRIAVEAVFPIFMIILLGMGAGRMGFLTDQELSHVNTAVFRVMFPIMIFYNIYSSDFSGIVIPWFMIYCFVTLLVVYAIGVGLAFISEKDNRSRGAVVQSVYRGNILLMGLPLMENLMGKESLGLTTLMIAVFVPTYNVLAVMTFEFFRGGKVKPSDIAGKIIRNPLILGALAGILAVLLKIPIPMVIQKPVSQITSSCTPIALLILGASFRFNSVFENRKGIVAAVAGKLLIGPGLVTTVGYMLGIRGIPLAILIVMYGTPCAVSGYTMAKEMDSNADLVSGCLIFTSLLSCVTVSGWIFFFKQLGAF